MSSSPVQRLFSRRTKTLLLLRPKLPINTKLLESEVHSNVTGKIEKKSKLEKYYHDKNANSLPGLEVRQPVYVQLNSGHHNTDWEPAVCSKKFTNKSYLVQLNGKTYRRNRIHLKPRVTDHDYSKDAQIEIQDDTSPALATNANTHNSTDSTSPVSSNTNDNKQDEW